MDNRFSNLKKARYYEFRDYLVRRYVKKEKSENIFVRFSIILLPIVTGLLFLGLAPNFLFTGRWGYELKWYKKWCDKLKI